MRIMRSRLVYKLSVLAVIAAGVTAGIAEAKSELPCLVKPQLTLTVGSPVVGVLSTVAVDQGHVVNEGDVLATIESSLEQAEVELAKAKAEMDAAEKSTQMKIEFSGRKSTRAKNLSKTSAIAQHEVDEAETEERLAQVAHLEALENRRLARLELERAKTALQLRTLRSPIRGVVVERFLSPGELVKQAPILKLARLDPLHVEVLAPVSWLGKIAVDMQGEVTLASSSPGPMQGRVTMINPLVNSASGTFEVLLELPNPRYTIPAGLPCTVRFAIP
ncbi:efflux RND transporter periplasmic adaptor subunit [Nitrospira sp. Nam80]